jgi:hypothetical protein
MKMGSREIRERAGLHELALRTLGCADAPSRSHVILGDEGDHGPEGDQK